MKKIEIIIKPERLEDVKKILDDADVHGLMITNIMGYGNQKGYVQMYRGSKTNVNLLPKIKVETVVSSTTADNIIPKIVSSLQTGTIGDGKIFVYNLEDAIRIRTGEHGNEAL